MRSRKLGLRQIIVFTLIGIGMLIGGIVTLKTAKASCGGVQMKPGQLCAETKNGVDTGVERTYDQQISKNHNSGLALTIIGGLIVAGMAGFGAVAMSRRNGATPHQVAPGYAGPQQFGQYGQYPQQPYQPQQGGHPQQPPLPGGHPSGQQPYQPQAPYQQAPYQQGPYQQGQPQQQQNGQWGQQPQHPPQR